MTSQSSGNPGGYTTRQLFQAYQERKNSYLETLGADYLHFPIKTIQIFTTDVTLKKYSDIEKASETLEGQAYNKTERALLGDKVLSVRKRTQSYDFTEEAIHYTSRPEVIGEIGPDEAIAGLYNSLIASRDDEFARMFYLMNTSLQDTVYNGQPIASETHTYLNSSVVNKNLMASKPLTDDSFEEMKLMASAFKLSNGQPMGEFRNPVLVVGKNNERVAKQIAQTMYDPYSANNTKNTAQGLQYKVLYNLPPAFDNYYWLVDMARMSGSNGNLQSGIIRPYIWNDRLTYDDKSGLSFGVPDKWMAASFDRFMTFDPYWVVMCPATESINPAALSTS